MGYEDSLATKILATHCICCGRPLRDPDSIELGIGPDCAKKYSYDIPQGNIEWDKYAQSMSSITSWASLGEAEADMDARKISNILIEKLALLRSKRIFDSYMIAPMILGIYHLGYHKLASIIALRFNSINVVYNEDYDALIVYTPFSREWNINARKIEGQSWNAQIGARIIPKNKKHELWNMLKITFPNYLCVGKNGIKILG